MKGQHDIQADRKKPRPLNSSLSSKISYIPDLDKRKAFHVGNITINKPSTRPWLMLAIAAVLENVLTDRSVCFRIKEPGTVVMINRVP